MKGYKSISPLIFAMIAALFFACEDKQWSEDYDIQWPVPVINSLSSEEAFVSEEITITGKNLDKVSKITLSGQECEIVEGSASDTQIKFLIARRASSGEVVVRNIYRRQATAESPLAVKYPDVIITTWPEKIIQGNTFEIEGLNVDLITEVVVDGHVIPINNAPSSEKLVVPAAAIPLVAGSEVTIKVKALGRLVESEVSGIPVEEAGLTFEAEAPIILWTFEDGEPTVTDAGNPPDAYGLNLGDIKKGRGDNYFSVLKSQTGGWTNFIYLEHNQEIDLTTFHDPHITFLVNTNGKRGYVNPFMTQNGVEKDNHLTNANAGERIKYGDDYAIQTQGWEWRSYPVSKLFPDFNSTGIFESVKLRFTSGNVGNGGTPEDFEIHIDQIMITDGLQLPSAKIFDFEEGAPDWQTEGLNPTTGLNMNGNIPLGAGDYFFSVTTAIEGSWKWFGNFAQYSSIDLTTISDPHISFLINTGDIRGMMQIETFQNDTKWGGSINTTDYFVETAGEWVPITIRLSDMLGNWGGDATSFDPNSAIDYLKFGFTTGNLESGTFEVNIDDIYISDGPMW